MGEFTTFWGNRPPSTFPHSDSFSVKQKKWSGQNMAIYLIPGGLTKCCREKRNTDFPFGGRIIPEQRRTLCSARCNIHCCHIRKDLEFAFDPSPDGGAKQHQSFSEDSPLTRLVHRNRAAAAVALSKALSVTRLEIKPRVSLFGGEQKLSH